MSAAGSSLAANSIKVLVDGQEFNSLDDLPSARAKYDRAVGALDGNRNGIPDYKEGFASRFNHSVKSYAIG